MATQPPPADASAGPIARAEALLAIGRQAEAIPWLERAIANDPHAVEPRCMLTLALVRLGRPAEALAAAEGAVAVAPHHEWPHRLRAVALLRSGRNQEARAAAYEAARVAPELAEPHVMCARTELAAGNKEAALVAAERAVSLAPERALTHEILGETLLDLNQLTRAEEHYRRALALDPQSFEAMNDLGVVLQRQGREREAIDLFLQAARLNPTSTTAQRNLKGSVDRHLSPGPAMPRPVWIGLMLLSLLVPAVRLVWLLWWLIRIIMRWSRRRALPPVVQTFYRLQERRHFAWTTVLLWVGVIGTLVFGALALILGQQRSNSDSDDLSVVAGCFLILTLATGALLYWQRTRRLGT